MIKGLERIEQLRIDINTSKDKLNDIEKELKALEIIRKSGYISIDEMLSYNYITRKEYKLLKEVLR